MHILGHVTLSQVLRNLKFVFHTEIAFYSLYLDGEYTVYIEMLVVRPVLKIKTGFQGFENERNPGF